MDPSNTPSRETPREYVAALDVLRVAKNTFLWLAVAAILFHVTAWLFAQSASASISDTAATGEVRHWAARLESSLAVAGFVARASVLIVTGVWIVSLLVSLSGRLGGAAGLARACVWSLGALALVTPWVHVNAQQTAALGSALYGYDQVDQAVDVGGILGIVRFVLCPLLVVACLLVGQIHFRRAYRKITLAPPPRLPIHEV